VTIKIAAVAVTFIACAAGCASAPKKPPQPPAQFSDKLSWILALEDRRILRDIEPGPPADGAPAPAATAGGVTRDLVRLAADTDPRVRRRAVLAIGRVGLPAGLPVLLAATRDTDTDVRQAAVFATGLLGSQEAAAPLAALLRDPDVAVRGRAAEALGQLGATAHASAIADMASEYVSAGVLASIAPDDLTYPMSAEIEAARLGIFALARLKSYDQLARTVLNAEGQPVSTWWPIAYALRRTENPAAAGPLRSLLAVQGQYTRAFSARGLGIVKAVEAAPDLLLIAADVARQPGPGVEAIRALREIGDPSAARVLRQVLSIPDLDAGIRAEAAAALGATGAVDEDGEFLLDILSDAAPVVRAAALRALGVLDQERLLFALSGRDPDEHWSVRAAVADVLGSLPPDISTPLLLERLDDSDLRVVPAVLSALVRVNAPEAAALALARLEADDPVVRATAAEALGELCPASVGEPLRRAYEFGGRDTTYVARAEALAALVKCDRESARSLAETALQDKDWALRLRAAKLLADLAPDLDTATAIRPAPSHLPAAAYGAKGVVSPPYATHAYFETDHGTFQVEFGMLDAPLTVHNFVTLARKGFFDGLGVHRVVPHFVVQDGDPRGDGTGGPGHTIRDELNLRPYLRGTMGMALDGPDTGGSQYFITHGPQPHLDGRYTVFGQVISGMDVVDRLRQWDVIRRVRVWDGETSQ
jgi:cyclophilin family peptidyl-prolyl cis-trans isomerase/HEAT repeat protein